MLSGLSTAGARSPSTADLGCDWERRLGTGTASGGPDHTTEQGVGVTLRQDGSRAGASLRIARNTQGLGRQPNHPRSTYARRLGQHSAELSPATPPCLVLPAEADLLPSAQGHGLDSASYLYP